MPQLLDLSSNNPLPDWSKIKADGVWLKATEGLSYNDSVFRHNRLQAAKYGVRTGAYHFARPDLHPYDPEDEAKHFCAVVGSVGRRDLRPVLDLEVRAAFEHLTPAQLGGWAHRFSRTVKAVLGVGPLFYSYPAYIQEMRLQLPVGYGLWLAAYGPDDGSNHPVDAPAPWKKIAAHQYTSKGTALGISGRVDRTYARSLRPLLAHPLLGVL